MQLQAQGARLLPLHWIRPDGVCSCGKASCTSPGKHPIATAAPRGVHDAVNDAEEVQQWWTVHPQANIGVATGHPFWVLDVDPRAGGDVSLADLEAEHGPLPDTPEWRTGGGGRHVLFTPDARVRNTASAIGPGLDSKADGGYVVAAGSNHVSGGAYVHDLALELGEIPLATAPEWLIARIATPTPTREPLPDVIRKGARNPVLWREACTLVRRGWQPQEIVAALQAINQRFEPAAPLEYIEKLAIRAHRRYEPAGKIALAAEAARHGDMLAPRPAREIYPLTDVGNRNRLVDRHGHRIRYCHGLSQFLVWDGTVWNPEAGEVTELAIETVAAMPETERGMHLVPGRKEGEEEDALPKWQKTSESAARIEAMVNLAKSHPALQVNIDDLDQRPWLLPLPNGTLDLVTGRLITPDPDHLMTLRVPVAYDPQARCPRFERFVNELFAGNQRLVRFVQEYVGYCLTGSTSEAIMLILHGKGSNGKSVLLDVLGALFGPYAKEAAPTAFIQTRQMDAVRNDLAALRGARFVTAIETNDNVRLDMATIKRATGGDRITARFLHKEFFSYTPAFKLVLATNAEPDVPSADHGTWRRLRLVPFEVQFGQPGYPPAENKEHLTRALLDELPGILNWALAGLARWRQEGLSRPDEVTRATAEYRDDQDVIAEFMGECVSEGRRVPRRELYNRYVAWCEANNGRALTTKTFGQRLKAKGVAFSKSNGVAYWDGIALRGDAGSERW